MIPAAARATASAPLKIKLLHKQRGQGKAWNPLEDGDRIRVDSRGKAILIQVSLTEQHADEIIAWDTLDISLYDTNNTIFYTQGQKQPDGHPVWQFHSKKGVPPSSLETQYRLVKVFLHPAHLCFRATVRTAKGERLTGTSITVQASISGTVRNNASSKKRESPSSATTVVELQVKRESPVSDPGSGTSTPPPSSQADFTVTSNLLVEGRIQAQGFFGLSDERLKNDIELLSEASNKLSLLEGCTFKWKNQTSAENSVVLDSKTAAGASAPNISPDMKKVYGFIAQRVAQILPEAVQTTIDGWLTVEYTSVVPVFIEALKEHVEKLQALQADLKEIQQLQESLKQLRLNLSSLASRPAPVATSTSTSPSPSLSRSSSSKKRRPSAMSANCPPTKPSQFAVIFGAVCLVILVLAFGLGFGLSANQNRPSGPSPVTFNSRNFVFDGSFEDPVSGWWGTAKIMNYNDTSSMPAASTMWETAPFDAGKRFAFFNTSIGLNDLNQDVPSQFDGNTTVQVIAWVFLPREISAQNTIWASLSVWRSGSVICSAKIAADPTKMYRWQLLDFQLTCWMTRNDTLRVTFQALGPDMIAAVDWVELRYPESMISTRSNMTYWQNGGRSGEVVHVFPAVATPSTRQESRIVVAAPDGSFVIGVVEISEIGTDMNVAIMKIDPSGRLDSSFGTGGVATIPGLLQTDFSLHGDWIAVDSKGRILVCGRTRLRASFFVPAIARLTPQGTWDTTFGGGIGVVPIIVSGDDSALSVFPRPNEKYVVVSLARTPAGRRVAIHRLQRDGRNDESFAFWNGNVLTATTANQTFAAIDSNDNVFLSWTDGVDARVHTLKVGSWGLINSMYGSVGLSSVAVPVTGNVVGISKTLVLSDGGLLILGGSEAPSPVWSRLHPNGALDPSWNSSAMLSPLGPINGTSRAATSLPDGSTIVSLMTETDNIFIRLFSNGSRDLTFCNSGSLVGNTSSLGRVGSIAANNQSVMLAASLPSDAAPPADASFVSLAIHATPLADRVLFQESTLPVPPRFSTTSIIVDPSNSSHVFLAGHIDTSLFVAAFDISEDSEISKFGWGASNMSSTLYPTAGSPSDVSDTLGAILPLQDSLLLLYSRQNTTSSDSGVLLEKRALNGQDQPTWGVNGSLASPISVGAQHPRGAVIPSSDLAFVACSTLSGELWLATVNISSGINETDLLRTIPSTDALYNLVERVETVFVVGSRVFTIGNVRSASGNTAGAIWMSDHFGNSRSLAIIPAPNGFSASYLMSGLVIPGDSFVYVGGFVVNGSTQAMMISRVNISSGSLDSSFGVNGILVLPSKPDSFGYIRQMFWQSSNNRIVAFGASAEPYSSLRVASFYFDPTEQTFDCMFNTSVGLHRYHQASLGVSDVVNVNGEYIVAIDTPQNLKYVRFTETELATCKIYCGDGLIEWDEWCDDGNSWNGDGCSSWCTTEPGWVCRFPGTPCN
eukprot:TRINITY_DN4813_c1_g1_i2.p1 TRINITY_DN4813_c1_g1~~TRINITY_DN4813_c1_g1_i2.p1  ORF type:complete len:1458 (-),score=254.99 TRINITY_DN4813_c1_g1_i2:95-4468(-)